MRHKIKMIKILSRLWKNTNRQLQIRDDQGKIGNWNPQKNHTEFKQIEKNCKILSKELMRLKKEYPISYLEILPTSEWGVEGSN